VPLLHDVDEFFEESYKMRKINDISEEPFFYVFVKFVESINYDTGKIKLNWRAGVNLQ
jgi:hypothetical protein